MEHTLDKPVKQQSALERAKADGVDITLLLENLKYTPQERLERHQRKLDSAQALLAEIQASGARSRSVGTTQIEQLMTLLSHGRVDFVLVGDFATLVCGVRPHTLTMAVCYRTTPTNIRRLCDALEPFRPRLRGAPDGLPFRLDPPTVQAGLNFTLATDLGDLDLLGEVAGLGAFEQVLAAAETMELFGLQVNVLSLEGLMRARRAAGRPKDLQLLPELESLLGLARTSEDKTPEDCAT